MRPHTWCALQYLKNYEKCKKVRYENRTFFYENGYRV